MIVSKFESIFVSMMPAPRKARRLLLVAIALGVFALGVTLCLVALSDNIVYFYTPTDIVTKAIKPGQKIRAGGLVKPGGVHALGKSVDFAIMDTSHELAVSFSGLLPDLFKEGQGVVVEGVYGANNTLVATSVLAKHDERYLPKQLADSLKSQGYWRPDQQPAKRD